jgi:NADH dehydrogenase
VYGRTKAAGEQAVRETFPGAMIVRPSIVFGPEDQFFNRFAALARLLPALPVIGGSTKFQPVFVGDVAKAIVAALRGTAGEGATLELGGPEILTMKEVLERVLAYTMRKRWLVPVPFPLAKLQGALLQFLPNAPLTLDQVRLLQRDNVVSEEARRENRTLEGLGIEPVSVDAAVPDYLEQYRPKGQFSDYRPR